MDIANLVIKVTSEGLDRVRSDLNRLRDEAGGAERQTSKFKETLGRLAKYGAVALVGTGLAALKTADTMQNLNNKIRVATDGAIEYATAQKEIERIAMTTYSSLESVGELYASNERALSSLGKSQSDVLLFTENISKAMSVSGGSAQSQAAAITQLGQAMASGVLRGDEFNSIAEQAPVIMDLLTKSLGVTRGELRAMAADGKITAEIVYDAVSGASETLDGMMGQTVTTMSQALTNVKTQWQKLSDGLINGEGGIGDSMASSINKIAIGLQDARMWLDEFLGRAETIAFVESLVSNISELWMDVSSAISTAYNAISDFVTSADFISTSKAIIDGLGMAWDNLMSVIKRTGEVLAPVIAFFIEHEELTKSLAIAIGIVAGAFLIYNAAVIVGTIATSAFTTALLFVTSPIVLIVAAMVALVAAGVYLYRNWDEIKAKALEVFGGLPAPIQAAIQIVVSVFKTQFEIIKTVVVTVWEVIKAIFTGDWGAIAGIVSNGTSKIGSILKEHFAVILSSFGTVLQSIKSKFLELFGGLPAPVQTALSAIGNIIKGQFQLITTIVSTAFNVVKALFSGEWGKAGQLTMQGLAKINSIVGSMFKAAWELVKVIFTGIGNSIVSILKGIGSKMVQIGRDIINGLANGIRDGASGAVNAARDMAGNVVSSVKNFLMIRSPSRVMKKLGEHTSEGMAVGIKQGAKIVKSEAQKMAEGAIDAVKGSIANLQKEISLFNDNSDLASFDYDVSIGRYKGAPDALIAQNRELITQKQTLIDLDKQQAESAELLAKARESIQERYAQLEKDKQSSANALNSVLGSIEQETPMGKIIADYENRLAIVATYEQLHTDMLSVAADARLAVEQSYMDAKRDLMLTQGEALFGSLSGMAKSFAGEQSGIYRALFAVEKGFAIAQSAIAIQQSIAKAMALGFPQNIPVIGAAVAQGATLLGTIKGIQPQGFKQGGYTGNGGSGQVAGVVHGQEYVFDAQSTKRIGVDNLNAMRSGKAANDGGGVVINNYSSAKIESRQTADGMTVLEVRDEIKRSWANLSNPNSQESKQINRNVQAPRRRGA